MPSPSQLEEFPGYGTPPEPLFPGCVPNNPEEVVNDLTGELTLPDTQALDITGENKILGVNAATTSSPSTATQEPESNQSQGPVSLSTPDTAVTTTSSGTLAEKDGPKKKRPSHDGKRKCEEVGCESQLSSKHELKRHKASVHGIDAILHYCPHPDCKSFNARRTRRTYERPGSLKRHITNHHGHVPLRERKPGDEAMACPVGPCTAQFISFSGFWAHLSDDHEWIKIQVDEKTAWEPSSKLAAPDGGMTRPSKRRKITRCNSKKTLHNKSDSDISGSEHDEDGRYGLPSKRRHTGGPNPNKPWPPNTSSNGGASGPGVDASNDACGAWQWNMPQHFSSTSSPNTSAYPPDVPIDLILDAQHSKEVPGGLEVKRQLTNGSAESSNCSSSLKSSRSSSPGNSDLVDAIASLPATAPRDPAPAAASQQRERPTLPSRQRVPFSGRIDSILWRLGRRPRQVSARRPGAQWFSASEFQDSWAPVSHATELRHHQRTERLQELFRTVLKHLDPSERSSPHGQTDLRNNEGSGSDRRFEAFRRQLERLDLSRDKQFHLRPI
jgi:hypothetical protein